jgi:protein-S-isoprenylcysteine O-methyltransferase Ste14
MKTGQLIVKQLIGSFVFYLVIFLSAGRINYWQGWIYAVIGVLMTLISFTVFKMSSELMNERSKPGDGAKKWDKSILGFSALMLIAMFIIAGLDSGRFRWSPDFHWSLFLLGVVLTIAGQLLFIIAQHQNKFFSSLVRIQTERGHVVYKDGLYKIVRHPAYLGNFIQTLGFPLLFGSLWCIIPVAISIILLLIRTHLEDKTLMNELDGYRQYTGKTRYKLIPYIW